MRATLFSLFIFFSILSYGQDIDSLKNHVENSPDSQRFELILNYMRALLPKDPQASYNVSEYALSFAEERADSLMIVKTLYAQGFLLRRMEQENRALVVLARAYGIARRNNQSEQLSRILNLQAASYTFTARYDDALRTNFEALSLNEKLGSIEQVGMTCNNIGLVYFKLRNADEAIKFYKKSLEAKRSIGSTFDLDRLYINMALCYNQLKMYNEAEKIVEDALAVCKENCSDEIIMEAEFSLGVSLLERGLKDSSKEHFQKSLNIARKLNNSRFEIENLSNMAGNYLALGDPDKAILCLQEAEAIAKTAEYLDPLLDVYKKFSKIYGESSDYEKSAFYSKKYSDLRDSVLSEELINNLATIQANYAERENLSTIADNQKVIRAQRKLNFAIAFIVVMAFAFIYLIMRNSRTIRRLNSRLAQEVQQKTMELVKSNHSLKQVNDELDNLVYKTSHDIRGPLATLKGVCNVALLDVQDPSALAFLTRLDQTASQLNLVLDKFSRVNEIYNTVIRPQKLDIQQTIDQLISEQLKTTRLKSIKIIKEIQSVDDFETAPTLFTYALSCLIDNAFRYYNESTRVDSFVKIIVERKQDVVLIRIIDNGVGIPVNIDSDSLFHMFTRGSERSLTGGMGLFIASTAVRKLQGDIKFLRSPDFILTEFMMVLPVKMDIRKIEIPKDRGKILPATTELIATLDSRFEK